jgi:Sulfate permease family
MANSGVAPVAHRLLPILAWILGYRRDWRVLAGLALWAVMVPEGMAYAGIVGVPPIMGLYTIVPALLAYALLGSSRQLVVGPDAATGLISAVTVAAIAPRELGNSIRKTLSKCGLSRCQPMTSTLAVLIGLGPISPRSRDSTAGPLPTGTCPGGVQASAHGRRGARVHSRHQVRRNIRSRNMSSLRR